MKIDYNKFTEQELRVILNAARTIKYDFGLQFPSHKEQLARAINQIVHQTYNAIRAIAWKRGENPDV